MERPERIGPYRITELLAQGSTSYVVAAQHEGPGGFTLPVALKTLRSSFARSPSSSRDFLFEARAAASVVHPHIAQVHGLVDERERLFLVMEHVRGWSLRGLCATLSLTRRTCAYEVAIALVRNAAQAVQALHDVGVLHRNLSPDNLLISGTGHIKVIDFGAASWDLIVRVRASTSPPAVDAAYAAPEVAMGLPADRPSDVYTLGAVLHELCLGAPPAALGWPNWRGAGVAPPTADLPDGLGAVIERSLRYAAQERFATAADFSQALEDVAARHRWRASPPMIAAYCARTFATRTLAKPISTVSRPASRRPPSELGRTRVRLKRTAS
ncbi:MAG TPA: serine/threonine-protein kinase [Kofleriaceae bacterium]|nr:serine/threonine-protein kinase [Kofleriaceae bacterium]